jgi:hypothetical protein
MQSDPHRAGQIRAQSAQAGREARGHLGKLMVRQAARRKLEANQAACDSAAQIGQHQSGKLTQALERAEEAGLAPASAAPPEPEPYKAPPPRDYSEWSAEEKRVDMLRWTAGVYAIHNTERVQLIRKLGGLPPDCDYEPPPPDVLQEIITGTGCNLLWADRYVPYKMPADGPRMPENMP